MHIWISETKLNSFEPRKLACRCTSTIHIRTRWTVQFCVFFPCKLLTREHWAPCSQLGMNTKPSGLIPVPGLKQVHVCISLHRAASAQGTGIVHGNQHSAVV